VASRGEGEIMAIALQIAIFIFSMVAIGILLWIILKIDEDIFNAVVHILGGQARLEMDWVKKADQKVRDEIQKEIVSWSDWRREYLEKRIKVRKVAIIFVILTAVAWFIYANPIISKFFNWMAKIGLMNK